MRITATSTVMDVILALGDGNPGALTILGNIVGREDGMIALLELDMLGLYGPDIWMVYKDECGEDLDAFIMALRSKVEAL